MESIYKIYKISLVCKKSYSTFECFLNDITKNIKDQRHCFINGFSIIPTSIGIEKQVFDHFDEENHSNIYQISFTIVCKRIEYEYRPKFWLENNIEIFERIVISGLAEGLRYDGFTVTGMEKINNMNKNKYRLSLTILSEKDISYDIRENINNSLNKRIIIDDFVIKPLNITIDRCTNIHNATLSVNIIFEEILNACNYIRPGKTLLELSDDIKYNCSIEYIKEFKDDNIKICASKIKDVSVPKSLMDKYLTDDSNTVTIYVDLNYIKHADIDLYIAIMNIKNSNDKTFIYDDLCIIDKANQIKLLIMTMEIDKYKDGIVRLHLPLTCNSFIRNYTFKHEDLLCISFFIGNTKYSNTIPFFDSKDNLKNYRKKCIDTEFAKSEFYTFSVNEYKSLPVLNDAAFYDTNNNIKLDGVSTIYVPRPTEIGPIKDSYTYIESGHSSISEEKIEKMKNNTIEHFSNSNNSIIFIKESEIHKDLLNDINLELEKSDNDIISNKSFGLLGNTQRSSPIIDINNIFKMEVEEINGNEVKYICIEFYIKYFQTFLYDYEEYDFNWNKPCIEIINYNKKVSYNSVPYIISNDLENKAKVLLEMKKVIARYATKNKFEDKKENTYLEDSDRDGEYIRDLLIRVFDYYKLFDKLKIDQDDQKCYIIDTLPNLEEKGESKMNIKLVNELIALDGRALKNILDQEYLSGLDNKDAILTNNPIAKNRISIFKDFVSKIIFKDRTTRIVWKDKTVTEVTAQKDEEFDKEKGIVLCIIKKVLGNTYHYYDLIKFLEDKADKDADDRANKKADKLARKEKAKKKKEAEELAKKEKEIEQECKEVLVDELIEAQNDTN